MNFLARIIKNKSDKIVENLDENPWAGLSSYQDPEKCTRVLKFCGRSEESFDVTQLIMNNILVTLYGKSGTGKTSLLNAGVFPKLRARRYMPINIRLSMDAMDMTFQQCIIMKINQCIHEKGIRREIEVVPMISNEQDPEYLWCYFARTRFENKEGNSLFPVLVFDQFEEIFRSRKKEAEILLRQICFLMDESHALINRMVNGVYYKYDFNFRFVISIREDELYRLEDSIDNNYLSEMKRCRYRLRSITKTGAYDVITLPGKDLIDEKNKQKIADKIIDIAWNKYEESINTNLLSLICYRIYLNYKRLNLSKITLELVDTFVSDDPFNNFYKEVITGLSNREKSYMEDHLVDCMGRRDSIPESDFTENVKNGRYLLNGATKILQRTSVSSDANNCRIELIHDSFCTPLIEQKQKRLQRKRILQLSTIIIVLIFISIGALWIINSMNHRHNKMLENESRFIAEKVMELVDEGDSYLARILALKVLPRDLKNPNRPYVSEAEFALRKSTNIESAILKGHTDIVTSFSLHPKENLLVSSSYDKTIRIWDTSTGSILDTLYGHQDAINSVNFSSDGKYIVSASKDKSIKIWNTRNKEIHKTLYGHSDGVSYAEFSSNDKYIVSASSNIIKIWNNETNEQFEIHTDHNDEINCVRFSPNDKYIVSASKDKTIKIWDTKGGMLLETLYKHTDEVNYVCFSKDGKLLLSASNDKTIMVWDFIERKFLYSIDVHSMVESADFSEDGKYIVSASWDNALKIWDTETRCLIDSLYGHKDIVTKSLFNLDGEFLVSSSWDNSIRIWDNSKRKDGCILEGHVNGISSIAYSGIRGDRLVSSENKKILIWDVKKRQLIDTIKAHKGEVRSVAFSPDGKRIVSASWDNSVKVWNAETFMVIDSLIGHTDYVESAFFSPDGKRIVSTSWDNSVRVWNAETYSMIDSLKGHKDFVLFATYSPNGDIIASCSKDSTIVIWDSHSFEKKKILKGHAGPITAVAFSPDGRYLSSVSNDKTIRIWNINSSEEDSKQLIGHTDEVTFSSFSSDSKFLVTSSKDNTIKIWNIEKGENLYSIESHTDDVTSVMFTPDDKFIISGSKDKTLRIWEFPLIQDLIDYTYERFKSRRLSNEESNEYYIN